jgi:hypothetical protein
VAEHAAPRPPSAGLRALISANEPLWAGEAEVFRTYWDWPGRTRSTDLRWLARQCYKELFDGFVPRLRQLEEDFAALERSLPRTSVLETAETVYEELAHYCAFADAYDALRGEEPGLDVADLERSGNWPENAELGAVRARHRQEHGAIGVRAQAFTEGGYCTLYSEGMARRGRGGDDDVIAAACAYVYDDEWGHMLAGITGLDDEGLDAGAWELLTALTVEQMRLRIRMRNAQFGLPVSPKRLSEIDSGKIEPMPFDYRKAGLLPQEPDGR